LIKMIIPKISTPTEGNRSPLWKECGPDQIGKDVYNCLMKIRRRNVNVWNEIWKLKWLINGHLF
jgi:hypothetical protein